MEHPIDYGSGWMLDESMDELGLPARLGQPVAMNCHNGTLPDLERRPKRVKAQVQVSFPEVAVPPVMVPTDHYDRHPAPEPGQRGGYVEAAPGNDPGVREPEVEEITVDEQAVAQSRHGVEELQQCLLDVRRRHSEVGIGNDDESVAQHGAKDGPHLAGWQMPTEIDTDVTAIPPQASTTHEAAMANQSPSISESLVRVNYSETDQMGVVYHARYLVWLDIARTEHLRLSGMSYRELEDSGLRLAVSNVCIRYRQPARYDDPVRIRCWVREVASRKVDFGYAVEHAEDGRLLATASTGLLALDAAMALTRLPERVRQALHPIPDPVKLEP